MNNIKYKLVDNDKHIRAYVSFGEHTTPVWMQQSWEDSEGEFSVYVRNNGCGHCCASMALRLFGVSEFEGIGEVNPYNEYLYCRKVWGAPDEAGEKGLRQHHWQTLAGITKVLRAHGLTAEYTGIPVGGADAAAEAIVDALRRDKLVIFCSHKTARMPDNPFSDGAHWVMAVGFGDSGKIVVANSSVKKYKDGIHEVDLETIAGALWENSNPIDSTWGLPGRNDAITGYVVVG